MSSLSKSSAQPTVGSWFAIKVAVVLSVILFLTGIALYKIITSSVVHFFKTIAMNYEEDLLKKESNAQLFFSPKFNDEEIKRIRMFFSLHADIDYSMLGRVHFEKDESNFGTATFYTGQIYLDQNLFNYTDSTVQQIIGHEISHLFDKYCMSDKDRLQYTHLRQYQTSPSSFYDDWRGIQADGTDIEWEKRPQEDFAEMNYKVLFSDKSYRTKTQNNSDTTPEILTLLSSINNKCIQHKQAMQNARLTTEAYLQLQQFSEKHKLETQVAPPLDGFGPWLSSIENSPEKKEFYLVSYQLADRSQVLTQSFYASGMKYQYNITSNSTQAQRILKDNKTFYTATTIHDGQSFQAFLTPTAAFSTNDPHITIDQIIDMSTNGKSLSSLSE